MIAAQLIVGLLLALLCTYAELSNSIFLFLSFSFFLSVPFCQCAPVFLGQLAYNYEKFGSSFLSCLHVGTGLFHVPKVYHMHYMDHSSSDYPKGHFMDSMRGSCLKGQMKWLGSMLVVVLSQPEKCIYPVLISGQRCRRQKDGRNFT